MRPIRLEFSGLHSYMEEQIIDFSSLGAYGLFGIFGPTGAGKSTILDAITLALYGKIVRAAGNLNGIIHLQCEKAHVALEFSLGDHIYLVERLLERDKKDKEKTNTKQCRLYDKTQDTVLADKAKQVDGLIFNLLGIGMEDFCRAVVLPQGKFQEFLTLTGKDRGEMLENIFSLEKYGDKLTAKILYNKNELELSLAALKGEWVAVAGFTEADKSEIAAELSQAKERVIQLEAEKQRAETAYHLYQQLEKNAQELKETEELLSQMEQERPQIEAMQTVLSRLKVLQSLSHSVFQAEDLTQQLEKETMAVANQKTALSQAQSVLENFRQQEKELPLWQEEGSRLEKAIGDVERLLPVSQEIVVLKRKETERQEKNSLYQNQLWQLTQSAETEKSQITVLKNQLAKIEEEKVRLQQCIRQRDLLEQGSELQKQYDLQQKNVERIQADCGRNSEKLRKFYEELLMWVKSICTDGIAEISGESCLSDFISEENFVLTKEQLMGYQEKIHYLAGQVQEKLEAAEIEKEKKEQQWQHVNRIYLRQQLSSELKPGCPCPVCGSLDHPREQQPETEPSESALLLWEQTKEQRISTQGMYEQCLQDYSKVLQQEEQFSLLVKEQEAVYLSALTVANAAFATAKAQWQAWEKEFIQRDQLSFAEAYQQLQSADKQWWTLVEQQEEISGKIKSSETDLDEKREQYRQLQVALEKLAVQAAEQQQQRVQYEEQMLAVCQRWQLPIIGDWQSLEGLIMQLQQQHKDKLAQIACFQQGQKEAMEQYQTSHSAYHTMLAVLEEKQRNRDRLQENVLQEAVAKGILMAGEEPWQQIKKGMADLEKLAEIEGKIAQYEEQKTAAAERQVVLQQVLSAGHYLPGVYAEIAAQYEEISAAYVQALALAATLNQRYDQCVATLTKMQQLAVEVKEKETQLERLVRLQKLCAGKKLIKYLAQEYLVDMAYEASQLLDVLTNHRYSLVVVGKDGFKENFIMIDAYNGGQMRPVKSLSGGETFLVSLALALALSNKIQLKGKYSLDFFFLDEGFGTLDEEKLEVVLSILEKLPIGNKMVGIITHVPEIKSRLPRFLVVSPAVQGKSSYIQMGMN